MTQSTVDTVIFDLGNVLIRFDPRRLFRKLLPDDASIERFFEETGFHAWNLEMDGGKRFADGIAEQSRRFPHYRPLFKAFFHRWDETVGEPIAESIDLLRTLKREGISTYALTNFSAETFPLALARFPFLADFDGAVVSGRERLLKPEPAICRRLLQRYSVEPANAVFIDDKLENVETARDLGLHGIHFVDPAAVRMALRELGLPV